MAEKWVTNDSAREMMRKYNSGAEELNKIAGTLLGINDAYLAAMPSGFVIEGETLEAEDWPDGD